MHRWNFVLILIHSFDIWYIFFVFLICGTIFLYIWYVVFRLFGIFDKLPIFVFLMKENKEITRPLLSSLHALLFFFSAIKCFDIDQPVTIYLISCDILHICTLYILHATSMMPVLLMIEKNKFQSLHNFAESIYFNILCVYIYVSLCLFVFWKKQAQFMHHPLFQSGILALKQGLKSSGTELNQILDMHLLKEILQTKF